MTMADNSNHDNENLVPVEGYTEDIKKDGSKVFTCKQCEKEIKTEQGVKMHITKKHEKEPIKRMSSRDDEVGNQVDNKKTRSGSLLSDDQDVTDFDFDPLNMETSSQIDAADDINETVDICADFLQGRAIHRTEFIDLNGTVDKIVLERAALKKPNNDNRSDDLIMLDASIHPDQDHNYILEDENDNDDGNDTLVSAKELKKKDMELKHLMDVNKKLEEAIKIKDETNDALTAAKNSLEDVITKQASKVNELEGLKSKYEEKIKTYGATIRMMDMELKLTARRGKDAKSDENINDLEEQVTKITKQLNDKQKELKNAQAAVRKKESAEKELQKSLNGKNMKISELESLNTRLKMMLDHTKELRGIKDKIKPSGDEKKTVDDVTQPLNQPQKCYYENNGTCRDQERCKYFHPKRTCQAFSKLGSCSQESLCEHRHPRKVCLRLQSTGYCAAGDRCRDRHPLEYAYQDLSQSKYRDYKSYFYSNRRFLGLSPHSLHGVAEQPVNKEYWAPSPQAVGGQGVLHSQQEQAGQRQQYWTPSPRAGGGQGVRHSQQEQAGQRQHQPQGWGGQMW